MHIYIERERERDTPPRGRRDGKESVEHLVQRARHAPPGRASPVHLLPPLPLVMSPVAHNLRRSLLPSSLLPAFRETLMHLHARPPARGLFEELQLALGPALHPSSPVDQSTEPTAPMPDQWLQCQANGSNVREGEAGGMTCAWRSRSMRLKACTRTLPFAGASTRATACAQE